MTVDTTAAWPVASGWNWRTYIGCERDEDGNPNKATASKIVGGWAPTEAEAKKRALRRLP